MGKKDDPDFLARFIVSTDDAREREHPASPICRQRR